MSLCVVVCMYGYIQFRAHCITGHPWLQAPLLCGETSQASSCIGTRVSAAARLMGVTGTTTARRRAASGCSILALLGYRYTTDIGRGRIAARILLYTPDDML